MPTPISVLPDTIISYYTAMTEGTYCFTGSCTYPYSINVVDANNCYEDRIIKQPIVLICPISAFIVNPVNPSCSGSSDGSFSIGASYGVEPYVSYTATNNTTIIIQNNPVFNGLESGSWTGYVQDSLGYIDSATITLTNSTFSATITPIYSSNTVCIRMSDSVGQPTYTATIQGNNYTIPTENQNYCFPLTGCGVETITICRDNDPYQPLYKFNQNNFDGRQPIGTLLRHTNGFFYGVTTDGGLLSGGTIYKYNTLGDLVKIHNFPSNSEATSGLIQYPTSINGKLYGTTKNDGLFSGGTIYSINPDGTNYQIVHNFSGITYNDGSSPGADLILVNGIIYGTTISGGIYDGGILYSLNISANTYNILHNFDYSTSFRNKLLHDSNILYGTDTRIDNKIDLFKYDLITSQFSGYVYSNLSSYSADLRGGLIKASNGLFYGLTTIGGVNSGGAIYTANTLNDANILFTFDGVPPQTRYPEKELIELGDGFLYGVSTAGGVGDNGTIFKIDLSGNNYKIIFNNFSFINGRVPYATLYEYGGYFYSTTLGGGINDSGTIYKVGIDDCCTNYTVDLSLGIKPEIYLSYINDVRNLCIYVEPNSLFQVPVTGYTVSLNGNVFGYIPTGSTDCFSFPGCDPIDVKFCTDSTQTCCYEKSFNYSGGTNIAGISNSIQFFSGSPYVCIDIDETTFLPPPYSVTITGNTITGGTYSYNTGLTANCYTIIGCGDLNLEIVSLSLSGSGCTYNTILNVPCQEPLSLTTIDFSNPCFDNSGYISVLANGGSPNYTYELINWFGQIILTITGGTNEVITFSNLPASTYQINVIDSTSPIPNQYILDYNLSNFIVTTNVVTATTGNTVCFTITGNSFTAYTYFDIQIEGQTYTYDPTTTPNCFTITGCGFNQAIITGNYPVQHDNYEIFHYFSLPTGQNPRSTLIQASNGNFYGLTENGSSNLNGGFYSANTNLGSYGIINFLNGAYPYGRLFEASNGIFYGTTVNGGINNGGTIFSADTLGNYGFIYSFTSILNGRPYGDLIEINGILYGMAAGQGSGNINSGFIFSCDTLGNLSRIHSFSGPNAIPPSTDGYTPNGSLINVDGSLFGMTLLGGDFDKGIIFSCDTNGNGYDIIYSFSGTPDGANPEDSLFESSNGYLYGTTRFGGLYDKGTIFKLSKSGVYTKIFDFTGTTGESPFCTLMQSSNGLMYGFTSSGGNFFGGTVFTLDLSDNFTKIHDFSGTTNGDGATPNRGSLLEASDGKLYGTTFAGGLLGDSGVIYRFSYSAETGCTFTSNFYVSCSFPPLGFEYINTNLYCCDDPISNASFFVKATGGTGNYTYLLSGITTNSSFTPTTYNPITDIATFFNITGACEDTDWIIIVTDIGQNPPQQLISNVITLNPTFNATTTFTINDVTVDITGLNVANNIVGYVTINGQVVAQNLNNGSYTYPISCGTNNTVVVSAVYIEQPPFVTRCSITGTSFIPCPFFCDYSFDSIVCPADTVDVFTVFITGGTPPYTITLTSTNIVPPLSFSTGVTNTTFVFDNTFPGGFAVPAGTWTLTVSTLGPPFDDCVNTFSIIPTFNAFITETSSTGFCFTVSGGTAPYEITLDSFTYPTTFTDGTHCLSANCGTHTLIIDNFLDNLPCPITLNFDIPCAPLNCSISTVNPNCGQDDGSILVTIGGGTTPYDIIVTGPNGYNDSILNTVDTTSVFDNLGVGTYTITVTDFNGETCVNTVTLTDSFTLSVTVLPINYSIGEICFNISGGLPPYTILLNNSFAWSGTPSSPTQDICLTAACGVNTSYLVFDSNQPCFVQLPTPFPIIEDSGFYDSSKWNVTTTTNCTPFGFTGNTVIGGGSLTYTGITTTSSLPGGCNTQIDVIQNSITTNPFGSIIPSSVTYIYQLNYGVNNNFFSPSGYAVPYVNTPFSVLTDGRLMPTPTFATPSIPFGTDINNQFFTGTITIPTTVIPTVFSGYGITSALSGGYGVVAQSQYTGFQLSILSYTVDCECAISGNTTIPCLSTPTIGIVSIVNPGCDETANGIITVSGDSGQPPYTYSATNGTINYSNLNGIFTGLISGTWYLSLVDSLGAVATLPSPITLTETFYANIVLTPLGFCVTITGGTPDYLVYLDNTLLPFNPTQGSNTVCYTAECGTTSIITVRDSG